MNLLACVLLAGIGILAHRDGNAQNHSGINYDETKIPAYTVPDPLVRPNGQRVASAKEWTTVQRPYLLQLFASHVYGKLPGRPSDMYFRVRATDTSALGGKAIGKQVTVYFSRKDTAARMDVLLYLPRNAKGKVPVFTGLNFPGNQTVHADPGIFLARSWIAGGADYKAAENKATEDSRGLQARRWPVEELLANGYGLATAYYGDLEPDHPDGWKSGVRSQLQQSLHIQPAEWAAVGAWAWGLCRMMDYLETEPAVDSRAVIITGHSRLGKAALWAAANDTRFAMVVANESGEAGAALSRRWYGETIERINTSFPYWFVDTYKQFNQKPQALPMDQHQLLALMAPRPVYVASAADDQWADPKGEFLGLLHAEPVYRLWNKKGLGTSQMPAVDQPVGHHLRYHIRSGKHDMLPYDWAQYIRFANQYFGKAKGMNNPNRQL